MAGGVLFIVSIGVVLGIVSGSFMLAVIFIIRHRSVRPCRSLAFTA